MGTNMVSQVPMILSNLLPRGGNPQTEGSCHDLKKTTCASGRWRKDIQKLMPKKRKGCVFFFHGNYSFLAIVSQANQSQLSSTCNVIQKTSKNIDM